MNEILINMLVYHENKTSTRATKAAIIMAKVSPALKEGAPHWKGYGTLILKMWDRIIIRRGIIVFMCFFYLCRV